MSHREEHDKPPGDPLNDLESALGALRPVSRLDRDRTLFRAGEAQAATSTPRPKARWGWPALAASLALIAIGQGLLLARRPVREIQLVYVPAAAAPAPPRSGQKNDDAPTARAVTPPAPGSPVRRWLDEPGPTSADRLTWQLVRFGLDALPATPVAAALPIERLTAGQRNLEDIR